jgi:molybdopterin converting factor small subunit
VPSDVEKLYELYGVQNAPVTVTLTGAFEPFTKGGETFEFHVKTMRAVLRALDEQYPGLGQLLEEESAVAVDGVINEIVYTQVLLPGSAVFFIPRLESG